MKKAFFYFILALLPFSSLAVVSPAFHAQIEQSEKRAKAGRVFKPNKKETAKRQWVALTLCVLGGWFGLHRFYLGFNGIGLVYLFTFGLFGLGWLIDILLLVIPGGLTPKNSKKY